MTLKAIYTNRKGASVVRIVTSTEAIDILVRGRYGATTAQIEDTEGNVLGSRFQNNGHFPEIHGSLWCWSYDAEALENAA